MNEISDEELEQITGGNLPDGYASSSDHVRYLCWPGQTVYIKEGSQMREAKIYAAKIARVGRGSCPVYLVSLEDSTPGGLRVVFQKDIEL